MKNYYIVVFFLISIKIFGNLSIEITSDQQMYSLNDTISVSVKVQTNNSKLIQIDDKIPEPNGLQLIGKSKSFSQEYSIRGGQAKTFLTLTYNLSYTPTKVGTVRFPPIKIKNRGKIYRSNSLTLNIVEAKAKKFQNNDSRDPFEWPFDKEVFIVAKADKSSVYPGEQITVSYYLYHRVDVDFAEDPDIPNYKDVWIEPHQRTGR